MNARLLALLPIAVLCIGCGNPPPPDFKAIVLANSDPWVAVNIYASSVDDFNTKHSGAFKSQLVVDRLLIDELLRKSLDAGIPAAYRYLFDYSKRDALFKLPSADKNAYRSEYAPKAVVLADQAAGTGRDDAYMLNLVGALYGDGTYIPQNVPKAAAYLARAWAAGSVNAPANLSKVFMANHDPANAYLWWVRCVGACRQTNYTDSYGITDTNGIKSLTSRQLLQIQEAALDKSVVTVNAYQLKDK